MPKARVNGIDLNYIEAGSGDPLLLIMGFGGDHLAWAFQMPVFAQKYRVIAFDNRGAGQSDVPDVPYTARMMAEDALDVLRSHDAVLMGAIGDPSVPDHVSLWETILEIRQKLDLWANLRPARLLPGIPTPLAGRGPARRDTGRVRAPPSRSFISRSSAVMSITLQGYGAAPRDTVAVRSRGSAGRDAVIDLTRRDIKERRETFDSCAVFDDDLRPAQGRRQRERSGWRAGGG